MSAIIKIKDIKKLKNNKVKVIFEYNNDLETTVCNYYGVKKSTKTLIQNFFLQAVTEGVLRHKRKGLSKK